MVWMAMMEMATYVKGDSTKNKNPQSRGLSVGTAFLPSILF